jgi:hypothetical protein
MTPEETDPPRELAALQALLAPGAAEPAAAPIPHDSNGGLEAPLAEPERVPLSMQAQPPRYLTARYALTRLGRWKSANSTPAP